ncbi:MAG: hypothetical protein R2695_02415 [Acidimicrobiales bacterium]
MANGLVDAHRGHHWSRRRLVIQRGDGTPAYHLVAVVDDAHQEIGGLRGDDLLTSTPRHRTCNSFSVPNRSGGTCPWWSTIAASGSPNATARWALVRGRRHRPSLLGALGRTLGIDCGPEATIEALLAAFVLTADSGTPPSSSRPRRTCRSGGERGSVGAFPPRDRDGSSSGEAPHVELPGAVRCGIAVLPRPST